MPGQAIGGNPGYRRFLLAPEVRNTSLEDNLGRCIFALKGFDTRFFVCEIQRIRAVDYIYRFFSLTGKGNFNIVLPI